MEETKSAKATVLTATERNKILYSWNDTQRDYPREVTLHDLVSANAQRIPNNVAVSYENRSITYAELEIQSNQIAHRLINLGVELESLVGVYLDRSIEMVVCILGILKAGAAYLPIDPEQPHTRIQMMLEDSRPAAVLTEERFVVNLDLESKKILCIDRDWSSITDGPVTSPAVEMSSENLAYVVYTSGSTGVPKGAQNLHRSVVNLMFSMARKIGINDNSHILSTTTLSFDPSVWEIFLPLTQGAHLTVASREAMYNGSVLQQIIDDTGVTFMRSTTSGWRLYLETGWRGSKELMVLSGGEALPLDLAHELAQRSALLWNAYGPAETAVNCTICVIPADTEVISIGRPQDNVQIYILDEERQPVPVGQTGELYIGGDGVGRGYLNRAELTAERFIPNPFVDQEGGLYPRIYRTGDLARYLPDGHIEFVGRNDSQVKILGRRVELGDIEAAIAQHPAIAQNLVMAREDTPGDMRLVAYLIPEKRYKLPAVNELRRFLRQNLPEYMLPLRYVVLEKFPVSPNGKIDRNALPEPEPWAADSGADYVSPRDEFEERVGVLFAEALNLDRVSIFDQFFDLGGNSILAARFVYRVQEEFHVKLTMREFLQEPSIAGFCQVIADQLRENQVSDADIGDEPIGEDEFASATDSDTERLLDQSNLTRNQFLMWLGQQRNADALLYNVVHAFHILGSLDKTAFRSAFQALVYHSDSFRTVFQTHDGVPRQEVLEEIDAPVEYIDLSGETNPDEAYQRFVEKRKMRPLPLDKPLFDSALVRISEEHFVWYLCQHHILTDAVSAELIFERMSHYYQLALEDRLGDVSEPPQFRDFVTFEREIRDSVEFRRALAYWRNKYGEPLPPTEFYGRIAPDETLSIERVTYDIGAERSSRLRAIATSSSFASPSEDLSLFTIFATLLLATIHRINDQPILRLGTPFHGRPTVDSFDVIGLFIEMGVMQVVIEEGETFVTLAEKVMTETLEGLAYAQPGMSSAETNRAYDVILNFIQATFNSFAGLPVKKYPIHTNHIDAAHNLRLQIIDYDDSGSFTLLFDMKKALFGDKERKWFVNHFLKVLDIFLEDHNQAIGDYSLLNVEEQQRLVMDFNECAAPFPSDKTVVEIFEEQVLNSPDNIAVVDGELRFSYAELNARSNQLCHLLIQRGIGPDTFVAICMKRSIYSLVSIWAVLKAGGAYIPIDPSYPLERISFMLRDSKPKLLLIRDDLVQPDLDSISEIETINITSHDPSNFPAANPSVAAGPNDLAYMIYTSGSTGKPKGVMVEHHSLLNYAWWARRIYQNGEALTFPLYSSMAFDLTVTSIFVPLISGGTIVVYGESGDVAGLEILTVVEDDQVDIVKLTPAHLAMLRELNLSNSRIRKLIVGGEDFKTELAAEIYQLFGDQIEIFNEYGPTEATVACMLHKYDPSRDIKVSVPIGEPAANMRVYLLDQYDQPVPKGVIGELLVSGAGVARGYFGRPDLTKESFDEDPFQANVRCYRTGDVGRWGDDGQLIFLGRRDHQVKISGARIELGEIESHLLEHESIVDAAVSMMEFVPHLDEREIVYCAKCGLPSNFPNVSFSEDSICSLCEDFDSFRDDVFKYFKDWKDLQNIAAKAKSESSGEYDSMMLYSGGKDSTYVLCQLVEMGLKVLAFSLDNGYISEEAKENVRRITAHLGVDLVFGTTPHMNAIFTDSLERNSNVCQGCYKTIYTLSMSLARQKGIKYIFTGLSRGQLFETRLDELFRNRIFDLERMDEAVLEARKVYHRVDDAVSQLLDVSLFADDRIFGEIQFVDFFRYTDVELDKVYGYLSTRVPWIRPSDTGRSTNCLINEAGIFVHQTERGYHNYALPYSWDVRLGHKTRKEVMEELNDEIRPAMVHHMLDEVGYIVKSWRADQSPKRLAAYYVSDDESLTIAALRDYLGQHLPSYMIPSYFVRLDQMPLSPNGKVDRSALPNPTEKRPEIDATYVAPDNELDKRLAALWEQTLNIERIGIEDNFFDLGGASIPAVQTVAKISDAFGVTFPVSGFFEHPTISGQSIILEELLVSQLEEMSDEEAAALLADLGG